MKNKRDFIIWHFGPPSINWDDLRNCKRKGKSVYILSKAKNKFNSIKRTNQNWMLKKSGCLQNRWNYDRYYVFSATLFSKHILNLIELCSFLLKENVCPPSPQKDNYELLSAENEGDFNGNRLLVRWKFPTTYTVWVFMML